MGLSAQNGYIMPKKYEIYHREGGQHKHIKQSNKTINYDNHKLCAYDPLTMVSQGFLRGVFLAKHLATTDNLQQAMLWQDDVLMMRDKPAGQATLCRGNVSCRK